MNFSCVLCPLLHDFPEHVDDILPTAPRHHVGFELSRFGLVHLLDQPVHGEVAPRKRHITWCQRQRRAEVVCPITNIQHPLVSPTTSFMHPLSCVPPHDFGLAHVHWTPQAVMGVEGAELKLSVLIKMGWVGEDAHEERAKAEVLQPCFDEHRVGVWHTNDLKVLWGAWHQEAQQGRNAWAWWKTLYGVTDSRWRDPLLSEVGEDSLHVLIVPAWPVCVFEPGGQRTNRSHCNNGIIATLIHKCLVKIKKDKKAPVIWGQGSVAVPVGLLYYTWRMRWVKTAVEDRVPHC